MSKIAGPIFGSPIGPWHRWFAWRPCSTADRGWRWMRPVWRRRYQTKVDLPGPSFTWFEYAVTDPTGDDRD